MSTENQPPSGTQPTLPGVAPAAPAADAVDWKAKFTALEAETSKKLTLAEKSAAERVDALKADPEFRKSIITELLGGAKNDDPVALASKYKSDLDAKSRDLEVSNLKVDATLALTAAGVRPDRVKRALRDLDLAPGADPASIAAGVEKLKAEVPEFFTAAATSAPANGAPHAAAKPPPVAGAQPTEPRPTGTPTRAQMEKMTTAELYALRESLPSVQQSTLPPFMLKQ